LVAGSLIGNTFSTLEECSLTSLPYRVYPVLVEAARRGDRSVVIHSLTTVNSPVIVAMVVNRAVSIKHQSILTHLLGQGPVSTLVELVTVSLVWICLETIGLRAGRVLCQGCGQYQAG